MPDAKNVTARPQDPPTALRQRWFPSAYTILFALIAIMAALTWVIPAGQYDRVRSEALGKDVAVAEIGRAHV